MTLADVEVLRLILRGEDNIGYSRAGVSRDPPISVEQVLPAPQLTGRVIAVVSVVLDHEHSVNTWILERVARFIGRWECFRHS